MRLIRVILILMALIAPLLAWAQSPYTNSDLGTISFNLSTAESHSLADMWVLTQADDGHIYGLWGDGWGWEEIADKSWIGCTQIQGMPGSLIGNDQYYDLRVGFNRKPLGYVAESTGLIRGFYFKTSDSLRSGSVMESTDYGVNWNNVGGTVFTLDADSAIPVGMLQAGPGYTSLPAHISDTYYYVLLGTTGRWQTDTVSWDSYGELYLARVPKADIETRASYEYVSAIDGSNVPTWTSTYANKIPIFDDPNGNYTLVSLNWWPQLDGGNGRWILAKNNGTAGLAIFEAPRPWGPWKTLYYASEFRDSTIKFVYTVPQKYMATSAVGGEWSFWLTHSGAGSSPYANINFVQGTIAAGDTVAPKAPTALQITTNWSDSLTYIWTPPTQNSDGTSLSDLAGYNIYSCDGGSCTDWTLVASLGTVTTYDHNGLTEDTIYRLMIRARDAAGNLSADSIIAEGHTAAILTLAMSATSTPDQWVTGPTTGQNKVTYVAEPDNGTTTYISSTSTNNRQQRYDVTDATGTITTADTILSVMIRLSARSGQSQTVNYTVTAVLGGSSTPVSHTATGSANPFQVVNDFFDTKPGGGAWTLTDLNNLQVQLQNTQARVLFVSSVSIYVWYVPDPAPRPPTAFTATVVDADSVALSWTLPTTNADGSPLTDLDSIHIDFCTDSSCEPDTPLTDLSPSATSHQANSLTTDTIYGFHVIALDTTGKLSAASPIVWAMPSEATPDYAMGSYAFYTPGVNTMHVRSPENTSFRVRVDGSVRLVIQIENTGAEEATSFPLECKVDAGSFATLTNTCSTGPCMRNLGGFANGATVQQWLSTPGGLTWREGKVATTSTWPTLTIGDGEFSEMTYDIGIAGLTDETVCCRPTGMTTPPTGACFSVYAGSARRG